MRTARTKGSLRPLLSTIFHVLIVAAIISLTCTPLFDGVVPEDWGNFVLVTLLTVFAFGAIGALIGVISTHSRDDALVAALFLPSMLLSGLMFAFTFP